MVTVACCEFYSLLKLKIIEKKRCGFIGALFGFNMLCFDGQRILPFSINSPNCLSN